MSGPREVWMIEDLIGGDEYHDSEHEAKRWAGAGQRIIHLREVDDAADERDGVAPDFRRLSVAMAYDSGVEAGRAAERARAVDVIALAEARIAKLDALILGEPNVGHRVHLDNWRRSLIELVIEAKSNTAAPRGTTREGG